MVYHSTPPSLTLHHGLQTALRSAQATYSVLGESADWLEHIATLLVPEHNLHRSGEQVRQDLFAYLARIESTRFRYPFLRNAFRSILKTTRS